MRVLRIARVLKLLKTAKGVRRLLETVAHALPQVGNLGLLFLLLFFIFAALGVELFGTIGKFNIHKPEFTIIVQSAMKITPAKVSVDMQVLLILVLLGLHYSVSQLEITGMV